ncbi:hypothetical protein YC2023_115307 [Brassica napus]|uniref:Uncharacterized protein n=1 Tax=Brassica oleracea TaxID=3712 RepID=A0A3P6DU33_BRAOL|nr:unnamed protein product [Brassica oleracea]
MNSSLESNGEEVARDHWPSLPSQNSGRMGRKVPATMSNKFVTHGLPKPLDRKEDDLRFPWAAKMNPASRNLYRATKPEYLEDGMPKRGMWHIDDCLMVVAPWTPEATLAIPKIKTIPIWATLKKIPNIIYSIPGTGLGAPMATHKPRLDPIHMGEAKNLVEVELSKAFPARIAATDTTCFIFMV